MKAFIQRARNKPDHIRELYAVGCTVVVSALVLVVWFYSFKQTVYVSLNPSTTDQTQTQFFASNASSLFGSIGGAFTNGMAQIVNLFKGNTNTSTQTTSDTGTQEQDNTHTLPVAGDR